MSLRCRPAFAVVIAALLCRGLEAQVIHFESGGLKYQTLSKNGATVMFAHLPVHLRDYGAVQAGISNGSPSTFTVRPEDFVYHRQDGTVLRAVSAKTVVDNLLDRAGRNDVIKLISTYESTLYGVTQFRSTNGYEQRRQAYLAELGSNKLKAAAAASAIAFVETRLKPGESTDGAVFFLTSGKPLGPGRLVVRVAGQDFEFESESNTTGKSLQQRSAPN